MMQGSNSSSSKIKIKMEMEKVTMRGIGKMLMTKMKKKRWRI